MVKSIFNLTNLIPAFVIAACLSLSCSSVNPVDGQMLVGIWNSVPDSSSQTFFNGAQSISYVRGYKQAAFDYKISDKILIEIDRSTGNEYQYTIIKLTSDSLTLKPVSADTKLRYWKSKSTVIVQRPY
ncbi:MAG: hypothetical protein GXC78_04400 [Chitinophagaceae bacterium]|nr:hypothetical protein [Chitinophagaceae bacterium]